MFVDRKEISFNHTLKPGLTLEELEDRMGRLEALEAGIIEGEVIEVIEAEEAGAIEGEVEGEGEREGAL